MNTYRPIEETYPFLDVTLSNGEPAVISTLAIVLYTRNSENGTEVKLSGVMSGAIHLKDQVQDFEKRLFEAMGFEVETLDSPKTDCPVSSALEDLAKKDPTHTIEQPEATKQPQKKR